MKKETANKIGVALSIITIGYVVMKIGRASCRERV